MTFGLAAIIGTAFGLPGTTTTPSDASTGYAARHSLPANLGRTRIGAYYCEAVQDGVAERVVVIIQSENGEYLLRCNES